MSAKTRNEANWQKAKWRRKEQTSRGHKSHRDIIKDDDDDDETPPINGPFRGDYGSGDRDLRIYPRMQDSPHQPIDCIAKIFRNSLQLEGCLCYCCCSACKISKKVFPQLREATHTHTPRDAHTDTHRHGHERTPPPPGHQDQDQEITGQANRHTITFVNQYIGYIRFSNFAHQNFFLLLLCLFVHFVEAVIGAIGDSYR